MQIVLKHRTNNSDHGDVLEVEVQEIDWEDGKEIITTDKGKFARSVNYASSEPFGWKKVE